jgi:photosystem II stability/assembly factor-like uncharacterized protein
MLLAGLAASTLLPFAGCSGKSAGPWESFKLGTSADLRAIWFADALNGWVAGGSHGVVGGLVGRTRDGGKSWRFTSNIVADGGTRGGLVVTGLRFFGPDRGVATIGGTGVYVTTDGGENWARARITGGTDFISDLMFLADSPGWAAGDNGVWRTVDQGSEWSKIAPVGSGPRVGGRAVHFVDESVGWLAGRNGTLLRTRDGGTSWDPVALTLPATDRPTLQDLQFVDERHGWVVGGNGTLFATRDGGASWVAQDTGVKDARSEPKLETIRRAGKTDVIDAGDSTPGLTLAAVHFVNPSTGWLAGHYPNHGRSLILHTRDGGASWRVEIEIAGEEIQALHVQGTNAIWAVGHRTREGAQSIYRRSLAAAAN